MVWIAQLAAAAVIYLGGSSQIADQAVRNNQGRVGTTMVELTRGWLGAPYRAFSLDQSPRERLQVDLQGFDCFLLVEQALALARSTSLASFERQLQQLRYGGRSTDYCHRQHYFTRWAQTAIAQGAIQDLNPELPGVRQRQRRLDFMSRHPDSYKPMQQQRQRDCIAALERNLLVQQNYIPLPALPSALSQLRNGDIFALVTDVDGLDVTHVGLVERNGDQVNGLHAAPGHGVIRSLDLARYGNQVDNVIGMSFYRPLPK
tara:strand:+ start:3987 stop:4766 length:780 start_codon:yes stop_codon:yes gene_type:complete